MGAEHRGHKAGDPLPQLGAGLGEDLGPIGRAVNGHGQDPIADVFRQLLGDPRASLKDAQERPHGGRGAIRIVAAIDGVQQRPQKISLAVEKPHDHIAEIARCLEGTPIRIELHHGPTGLFPLAPAVILFHDEADGACHAALGGNEGQGPIQRRADIRFHKGHGLQGGGKDLRHGALGQAVIHTGVHQRVLDRDVGAPGRKACPDLGADPGAVGVVPGPIVQLTAHGG